MQYLADFLRRDPWDASVQMFLGHLDPETTAIYTAVRPQRIAAMVDTFRRPDLDAPPTE